VCFSFQDIKSKRVLARGSWQGVLGMSVRTFVGIDGIPGGWVAVYLDSSGGQRFDYAKSALELLSAPYARAMIDMPIGLPVRGYRQCDIEARAIVGSRVFLGARTGVWLFKTLDEANASYWQTEGVGRGISMQLFCIRDKLRELNESALPPRLFEAHPEMIFWRMAGRVLEKKNSEIGREERIALLESKGLERVRRWLGQRQYTGIRRDDLIDACACAVAARDSSDMLPAGGALTGDNATAQIWY
jgi:predicted RNase H-like nuclease